MTFRPLDRAGIAARIAQDIPEGWLVNLGIGIPTGVSNHVPIDREVIFHSENGVIGAGPAPAADKINPYLVNAGTQHITLRTGGSFVHHADSFAIARGGHLDLCVLGAFEVAENGDVANWARSPDEPVKQVGEEFVSGTRLGVHDAFRLAYEAIGPATVTVRRTQTARRVPVQSETVDGRTVRPLAPIETGSIYEVRYLATKPRVLGIGFAATRDIVSHLRHRGDDLMGRPVEHTIAFGISQAGRYLRDHIVQGFNRDEQGRRVFDGILTHVAGIGRVFHNTPFGQPFRTRTWHEDHDFPELEFPHSSAAMDDPVSGASGALMRGDASDPKLIETNTSTEYWQKGASLLHTDPLGTRDIALPANVRTYLIAGTQHGGKAGMPHDNGPCCNPRNWHDPMPAIRALLLALDEWVSSGRIPPDSRVPRISDGTLVSTEEVAFPAIPGVVRPSAANDAAPLVNWADSAPPGRSWVPLVPQVDADGNERAGIRLPDIAVPRGTFTGWNLYRSPYPDGELADRDGSFLAFAATDAERGHDPRPSLAARYPGSAYSEAVRAVTERLLKDRLLLPEDAAHFLE